MTRRSKIRQAEMEVVDAADAYVTAFAAGEGVPKRRQELIERVEALRDLGLVAADAARTSNKAPLTSEQAAAFMDGDRAQASVDRIVRFMVGAYPKGVTRDEAMDALGLHSQSTYGRFSELKDCGWIVETAARRATKTGHPATVCQFSERAVRLLGLTKRMPRRG